MTRDEALDAYREATARIVPWPLNKHFPEMDLWGYLRGKYSEEEVKEISKWTRGRYHPGVSDSYYVIVDPDFRAAYDKWISEIRMRGETQEARNRKIEERIHAFFWGAIGMLAVLAFL